VARKKATADLIGNAVKAPRMATDRESEEAGIKSAAAEMGRRGGEARAASLSKKKRADIAKAAATARWASKKRADKKPS
jgi:hypothetical protein